MGKTRTMGSEWTEVSGYRASSGNHPQGSGTILTADLEEDSGDVIDGLRSGLILSAILWVALICAGLLVLL